MMYLEALVLVTLAMQSLVRPLHICALILVYHPFSIVCLECVMYSAAAGQHKLIPCHMRASQVHALLFLECLSDD